MAINFDALFSPRSIPADANYPYGSAKDETSPGANDGTPFPAVRSNDIQGFFQWLLSEAGIVPSGSADTVLASQYGQSMLEISQRASFLPTVSGVDTIAASGPINISAYKQGQFFRLESVGANTGPATLNINALGAVTIARPDGSALQANDIPSSNYVCLLQKRASDFVLLNPFQAAVQMKLVQYSRLMSDASATVGYTGAGFAPDVAIAIGGQQGSPGVASSIALMEHSTSHGLNAQTNATNYFNNGTTYFLEFYDGAGGYQVSQISSRDADGISLSWAKTGTPTFTAGFAILYIKYT